MTIEQRAEEYMNNYPNMDDIYYDYYVKDGYIKGATEQQEIDINRACEWLRNNAVIYLMKEELGDFIDDFRIAMKGE